MFEITQPTSTTSIQSPSLTSSTKPPKGDSGVIRNRPISVNYELSITISNEGNEYAVQNLYINANDIFVEEGPELAFLTKEAYIEELAAGQSQEVTFTLAAVNPENLPQSGNTYSIQGTIDYQQTGEEDPLQNPLNVNATVSLSD